jgi:hypothetical protein
MEREFGGVEHNWMQTLPERPQRGHWEFLFKNKNRNRNLNLSKVGIGTVINKLNERAFY